MALPRALKSAPPTVPNVIIDFPADHVILITLNRPRQLNAIPSTQHYLFSRLFHWYDSEPWLRCAIITGTGRAFCAGADLKEWNDRNANQAPGSTPVVGSPSAPKDDPSEKWPSQGFGGLSNRGGKKPVVAAVNGLCLGGGMEMVINTDIVIASEEARFGLPEVKRGVVAIAGALPRLASYVGRQRASEMALTGRIYTPAEMVQWGLVNRVVPCTKLVEECLSVAQTIAENSPDSVIVSREGLKLGWEPIGPVKATKDLERGLFKKMEAGENMREGLLSFMEKRDPRWKDSKL